MGKAQITNPREMHRVARQLLAVAALLTTMAVAGGVALATTYPILHNSSTANSKAYWNISGGWGVTPTSKYGRFTCATCHNNNTTNIKRIGASLTPPKGGVWNSSGTATVSVNFTNVTGQNSFGDDSTNPNYTSSARICEVCHSKTIAHRYDNSPAAVTQKPNHQSASRTDCTSVCHPHSAGFKASGSCTTCHGNPPTTTAIGGPDGLASPATNALGASPASPGAHAWHYTTKGIQCYACHNGYTTSPMGNNRIEIGFAVNNTNWTQFTGSVTYGNFSGNSALGGTYQYQTSGSPGTTFATSASTRNSCNVYCHGNWQGSGRTLRPSWIGGSTNADCGTCHGASAALPPTRGSHSKHASNGTTAYALTCTTCHQSRPNNDTAHITGSVQWRMSTGMTRVGPSATYNGLASGSTGAVAPSVTYQNCNNVYCHSYKANDVRSYRTVQWGATLATDCTGCHGNDKSSALQMTADAHKAHMNNASVRFSGMAFKCNECHASTVNTDNRTLQAGAYGLAGNHTNATATVVWGPINTGSAAYTGGSTCATTYCHSDGVGGAPKVTPTAWNGVTDSAEGNAGCNYCHGGLKVDDPNHIATKKHARHIGVGVNIPHADIPCYQCHRRTATVANAIMTNTTGLHLNKALNVSMSNNFNGVLANYTGLYTKALDTCANTYCHGKGITTPAWGSVLTRACGDCHITDNTNPNGLSVSHVKHYNTATDVTSANGWTNTNGSTGTTNIFYCGTCHSSSASHVNGPPVAGQGVASMTMNLLFGGGGDTVTKFSTGVLEDTRGFTWSPNTTCSVYCHSNGRGKKRTPAWTAGSVVCGSCHARGNVFYDWSTAHNKHLNTYKLGGSSIDCYYCHSTTVNSTSTSIANVTNHPNGTKTVVSSTFSNFTWTAAVKRCSTGYCHSAGVDFTSPFTNTTSVPWVNKTTNCGSCHGASSANPEPNYASGSPKANSHGKHATGLNYQCVTCHSRVVDALRNISSHALHVNQAYNVNSGGGYSFTLGNTPSPTTAASCTSISCHNNGSATWGGAARKCSDCHGTTGADVVNYVQDGTGALINTTEWDYSGHGKTTGTYDVTAAPAANFPGAAGTGDPCEYCHDRTLNHYDAANPLRLRNFTHATYGKNGVCLACHGSSGTGVDPDGALTVYANKTATKKINKYHYGSQHSATLNGGQFCWDCHDGHGDSTTTAGPIIMTQKRPALASNATTGVPTSTATADLVFSNKAVPGDLSATASPFTKICNICHTYKAADPNKMVHYTNTSSDSHNSASLCTNCHKHNADNTYDGLAYKGQADCLTCHASRQGTGVSPSIIRAAVYGAAAGSEGDDFIRKSRHVSNGTIATPMVTNFDCIVCHAEGDVASSGTNILTVVANHGGDGGTRTVDLRDVDSVGGTGIKAAWPGRRLSAFTATTTDRNNLDWFCVGCHDSNGASTIAVNNTNTGLLTGAATAVTRTGSSPAVNTNLRPFNTNDNLKNYNDISTLGATRASYGKVLNVKDQFNSGNAVGSAWASHHNLNIFTNKRYATNNTTYWPAAAFTSYVTKEGQTLNSGAAGSGTVAGLHCSDCHLNEVNAHGSRNTWYMLADKNGTDTAWANTGASTDTHTCYRCHINTTYASNGSGTSSRFNHYGGDAPNFLDPYNNMNNVCFNCHGGYSESAAGGLGAIHGNNDTYTPAGGSTKRYRFMSGAAGRKFNPTASAPGGAVNWATSTDYGCYTLAAADSWTSCTKHSGGTAAAAKGNTLNRTRPLDY